MSCAKWDHAPLSFYCPTAKGGAINIAYRLTFRPCSLTTAHLQCLITIGSVHLRSNDPRSSCAHLFRCLPPSHLRRLFSRSFSLTRLVHLPCSPRPLIVPCARRTKVTDSPVPFVVAPQQPYLTNNMAKGKKDRAGSCNCI